ncbi:MAG: ribonuclease HI family protein [Acidimicrobiia bacterium]
MTLFDQGAHAAGDSADGAAAVTVSFDGGSRGNPGPAAIGAVVADCSVSPPRVLATVSETIGVTTNNVAEYRAAIAGLEAARAAAATSVVLQGDSKLVIEQLAGRWKVRQPHLRPLHEQARRLLEGFASAELVHVRRERNTDADALVNAALDLAETNG